LSWFGAVGDAKATDFGSGPALVVNSNKSIALYAIGANGRSILRQQSAQAWQDTTKYSIFGFTSELGAASFHSQVYFDNFPQTHNGTLIHHLICGAEKMNAPPGQPMPSTVRCWGTNMDRWAGVNELTILATPWTNSNFRTATPAVLSLGLDSTGVARVYAVTTGGTIAIGTVDGTCPATNNTNPCFRHNAFISAPADLQGLGAALVNEGAGLRVMLCGVKSNTEYWCSKSTDAGGNTFSTWQQVPGTYSGAPAVTRWHTGWGDSTKTFGMASWNSTIWTASRFLGIWGDPTEFGGEVLNPITTGIVSHGNNPTVLELFGRGMDGRIWHSTLTDSDFSGWTQWLWQ
jgi:hypothetical protein